MNDLTGSGDSASAERFYLIDDDPFSRSAIAASLEEFFGSEVRVFNEWSDAAACDQEQHPNVVLVNLHHWDEQLLDALPDIVVQFSHSKVVLLVSNPTMQLLDEAFDCGMAGVLQKNIDPAELVAHLRSIIRGYWVFVRPGEGGPGPTAQLREGFYRTLLRERPERDLQIVRGVALGLTNRQIGQEVHMSESNVKVRVNRILVSLNLTSRTQLSLVAADAGLVRVRDLLKTKVSTLRAGAVV